MFRASNNLRDCSRGRGIFKQLPLPLIFTSMDVRVANCFNPSSTVRDIKLLPGFTQMPDDHVSQHHDKYMTHCAFFISHEYRPDFKEIRLAGAEGLFHHHQVLVTTMNGFLACRRFRQVCLNDVTAVQPRWPEVVDVLKKIVEVYAASAKPMERLGEWIERIGWEAFFRRMEIPFTKQHIDDFTHAVELYRTTTQFKW